MAGASSPEPLLKRYRRKPACVSSLVPSGRRPLRARKNVNLIQVHGPAIGVLDLAGLDPGQRLINLLGGLARAILAVLPLLGIALVLHGADRRDDHSSAHGEGLVSLPQHRALNPVLNHLVASVLGDLDHTVASHTLKDGVLGITAASKARGVDGVALAEEDVRGADLLEVLELSGVEVQHVVEALFFGLHLGEQRAGIVADSLDAPRPALRSARVLVVHLELDGSELVPLEVAAHRRHVHNERVAGSRREPQDGAGADDEGAQVERSFAEGRHPLGVGDDGLLDGVHEDLLRHGGHAHALAPVPHAAGVLVRPEDDNAAILRALRLHPLEDPLPVVEHARAGRDLEIAVGLQLALGPLASRGTLSHHHVVRLDAPPGLAPELLPVHRRRRMVRLGRVQHRPEPRGA
mmetsp:Transcript_19846/g.48733  ORF Transcript_19846/g.48733 Transcript_19846/m.48733 type:complete len:407 (+) Transcript_19846:46-1266(+)